MILKTASFKDAGKFLNLVITKDNVYFSHIFLDFKEKLAYAQSINYFLRFPFDFEVEDSEKDKIVNLYIDSEIFLPVCNFNSQVSIDWDKREIVSDSVKVSVPILVEDMTPPDFSECSFVDIEFTDKFFAKLKRATQFIADDQNDGLAGLFIRNGFLIGTNRQKFYNFKISEKEIADIEFSKEVLKALSLCSAKDEIKVYNSDKYMKLSVNEIDLFIPKKVDLDLPVKLDSEEFISMYSHPDKVIIKKSVLEDILQFTNLFISKASDNRIYLKITTDNKIMGAIKEDAKSVFSRNVFDVVSTTIESEFYMRHAFLKAAIDSFESENIMLQVSNESSVLTFTDGENLSNFVVMTKIV